MNDKEYKKLEKLWYQKLKKDGFDDIEDTKLEYRPLKVWSSHFIHNVSSKTDESKLNIKDRKQDFFDRQTYFHKANHWLEHHTFNNKTDKKIWTFHAEGLFIHQMLDRLKSLTYFKIYRRLETLRKQFEEDIWNAKI